MAASAPTVQTLSQVMAELEPASSAVNKQLEASKGALTTANAASKAAIEAKKVQGFDQINNQATGKGLSFSGMPINEQAKYLSTEYLPGMQQADAQMQKGISDIGLQQATNTYGFTRDSLSRIDGQKSSLNSWNMAQMQIEASAKENALNRAASASESAANRAASSAASTGPTENQFLMDQFASYYTGDNMDNGWTEKKLAGDYAAAYGISRADALGKIYKFRKDSYGN